MAQKTHTDLSPSNAERWMNCPGSVALCASMPKPEQSAYAGEGQAAHDLLERCLKNQQLLPYDQVGEIIHLDSGDYEVTEEMAEAVSYAREQILSELQKGGTLLIETRLEIAPGIYGTLDAAIVRPFDTIIVFDFKYGKGIIVSAVDNPQLLLYALPLAVQTEVKDVKIVILQPRTEDQISSWTCDYDYLSTFSDEVNRKIALTKEPNALVCAGPWCKWCWAKPICPVLRQDISKNLPAIPGKEILFPDVKGLAVPVLKKILDYKDLIENWLAACAAYAQEIAEAGGDIPGYELAKKRANRKWINEEEAIKAFQDLGEQAYKVKILSPAAMEKIAGKERVAKLTEVPDNGMTLKKIADNKKVKELLNDTAK